MKWLLIVQNTKMKWLWYSAYYGTSIFVVIFIAEEVLFAMDSAAKPDVGIYAAVNLFASLGIVACIFTMWCYGFYLLITEAKSVHYKKNVLRLMYLLLFNGVSGYQLFYLSKRNRRNELSSAWGW